MGSHSWRMKVVDGVGVRKMAKMGRRWILSGISRQGGDGKGCSKDNDDWNREKQRRAMAGGGSDSDGRKECSGGGKQWCQR